MISFSYQHIEDSLKEICSGLLLRKENSTLIDMNQENNELIQYEIFKKAPLLDSFLGGQEVKFHKTAGFDRRKSRGSSVMKMILEQNDLSQLNLSVSHQKPMKEFSMELELSKSRF